MSEEDKTCGFCDKPCGNPWCITKRRKCPDCKVGILEYVSASEPYSDEHYQCSKCDGTYPIFIFEEKSDEKE